MPRLGGCAAPATSGRGRTAAGCRGWRFCGGISTAPARGLESETQRGSTTHWSRKSEKTTSAENLACAASVSWPRPRLSAAMAGAASSHSRSLAARRFSSSVEAASASSARTRRQSTSRTMRCESESAGGMRLSRCWIEARSWSGCVGASGAGEICRRRRPSQPTSMRQKAKGRRDAPGGACTQRRPRSTCRACRRAQRRRP